MSCSSLPSYVLLILQHGPDPRCLAVFLDRKHALHSVPLGPAPRIGVSIYLSRTCDSDVPRLLPPPSSAVSHERTALLPHARPHPPPHGRVTPLRRPAPSEAQGSQHPRLQIRTSTRERVDRAGFSNIRGFSRVERAGRRGVGGRG